MLSRTDPESEPESEDPIHDIEEVSNYVRAMNQGIKRLEELPVCTRLIKEIHAVLMKGVRGQNKRLANFEPRKTGLGGRVRRSQPLTLFRHRMRR